MLLNVSVSFSLPVCCMHFFSLFTHTLSLSFSLSISLPPPFLSPLLISLSPPSSLHTTPLNLFYYVYSLKSMLLLHLTRRVCVSKKGEQYFLLTAKTPCRLFLFSLMMMEKKSDTSAQDIQADLSEIERDLTLRGLLWQSLEEWTRLVEEWTATSFDSINVESLQKNVNKFTQTVYMLEKGNE